MKVFYVGATLDLDEEEDNDLDQDREPTSIDDKNNNIDAFIANLDSKIGAKKSFELKYENDDDDEIFIVHEEDDQEM